MIIVDQIVINGRPTLQFLREHLPTVLAQVENIGTEIPDPIQVHVFRYSQSAPDVTLRIHVRKP